MPFRLITPSPQWTEITAQVGPARTAGKVYLQRKGTDRVLVVDGLTFAASGSGGIISGLSTSDRPPFDTPAPAEGLSRRLSVTPGGTIVGYSWTAGTPIYGRLAWSTEKVQA